MNIKILFSIAAFSLPTLSFAKNVVTATTSANPLKPLNNVRVSMQRMMKSTEGRYFLSLYAGIAKPHATMYDLVQLKTTEFRGTQKGNQINLNSVSLEAATDPYEAKQLSGVLNVNTGILQGTLVTPQNPTGSAILFEPAFKVVNKPLFTFKFYGVKADTAVQEQLLTRVDVINKTNNTVAQTLTGFSAYPGSIGYMDINFDGYYDVILSDLSRDRKIEDKRYIYWMYNPKTKQFQRSPQLEKLVGLPVLHGEKKQIDYGNGQLYQVENGLLNRVNPTE
ncbi:XAC2610-related protein [Acinetobacter shaoyimingii]|uniref:VCBS repeat-containing protein n=1 Tax=Acinetobacter shaoyimingii TaxID=2715164 RepID=A0A6G8RYA7_9GAMM|nr:hypothetical protein [Acinetobacter shaoyimingii]QIO06887.1 hypothetical protein G8E00_13520 [Acinetobacter shaoyimingii]